MNTKRNVKVSVLFISLCIGLQLTISPVLNQIQEHYPQIDRSMIQMLVTAPALLSAAVSVICGWLITRISMKKLLLFAACIAGVTGFIPLLYDSFWLLLSSRVLLGVAIGLCSTLNTAVIADNFHGEERVSAMGMQSATIGVGYLLATTLGGIIGNFGYRYTYYIHFIGFLSLFFIWKLLPDTGKKMVSKQERIKMNSKIYRLIVVGFLEVMFLFVFSTNISMHMSGTLANNASVAGILIGVFSGIQIFAGLALGHIAKYVKQHTMALGMLSLSIGCFLILLKPDSFLVLLFGAAFCGISQGIFVPQILFEATSAVKPVAVAMASALLTVSFCLAQLVSPYVFNSVSSLIWGSATTTHVYTLAAVGMFFITLIMVVSRAGSRR